MDILLRRKTKSQRGNLLAMAMAFMFVLVTIVVAMHTSQARAVRNVTQAEAELQFRQSSEFAAAELFFGAQPLPSWLKVAATPDLVGDHEMPALYGNKLWTGLPNWNPKDQEFAPGHRTYKLEPDTNDQALKVFAGKFQWMVAHNDGGYAAYAPKGTITLEQGVGWANPAFLDERPSSNAYSGVPFMVASKGAIEVASMPYGSAYSVDGPLDLGSEKKDLGIAFKGPLPLRPYEEALKKSLQDARTALEASATSGNKTNDIKGSALDGAGSVFSMLTSGDPSKLSVSLEQAMKFPFPTIPSFSITVPGVFFEFWFHVPYPPDFASFEGSDNIAAKGEQTLQTIKDLEAEKKSLEAQLAEINAKIAAETDPDEKVELQEDRDLITKKLEEVAEDMDEAQEQAKTDSKAAEDAVEMNMGAAPETPQTRAEDGSIPNTGMKGWNYSKLLGNMLSLLWNTITGDLEEVGEDLMAEVRLVHFGPKDNVPGFRFDDGFFAKATWTVPRGRSFRIDNKMKISGDLWLQKGSVMHVRGDLTLEDPNPGESDALKPSGKLVIEEGATLIVDGDFKCAGDAKFGSMWVCSPPTRIAPISSSIFVTGSATIPFGSFSASNLEDAARALEPALADALEAFFTDIAPNLSKISGAFHERQPYFASYATTFQLTIIPPTIFNPPIPIPTPIPLPKENLLIPLFRVLTTVYTGGMNAALGENTYAHTDWWGFGDGVVPAMIKLDPMGPMNAIKGLNLDNLKPNLDWEGYVDELAETVLKGAAEFAIKTVGKKIITSVMAAVAPGGSIISEVLNQVLNAIDSKESAFDDFRKTVIDAAVGPIIKELENFKKKVEDEIENGLKEAYMREVAGPLLYAKSINVGDAADPPLLMAGMLVAEETINVNTESFVGSLTSFNGNISAGKAYFTPVFTRASLYKPKATSTSALTRVVEHEYGKNFDSGQAVDVGTGVWQVTTEGWSR